MRFNPCKAKQPLTGIGLQKTEEKDEKDIGKFFRKAQRKKMSLLTLT